MPRKRLTIEQIAQLKFEDCRACALVLTRTCKSCDAGEQFKDADEPEDVYERMQRWN